MISLQAILNIAILAQGGMFSQLRVNSVNSLGEKTESRGFYIQTEMIKRWGDISDEMIFITNYISKKISENNADGVEQKEKIDLNNEIINELAPELVAMLRHNETNGIFLILNNPVNESKPDKLSSLYLRVSDPTGFSENNEDLLCERGLPSVSRNLAVSLDIYWEASFDYSEPDNFNNQFYSKPFNAASEAISNNEKNAGQWQNFAYWSKPHKLSYNKDDIDVITYSAPIIIDDEVYGVFGIEITVDYFMTHMNYEEISNSGEGIYMMLVSEANTNDYSIITKNGPHYRTHFSNNDNITLYKDNENANFIYADGDKSGEGLTGYKFNFEFYKPNTPFYNTEWSFISLLPNDILFEFANKLIALTLLSTAISFVVALMFSLFVTRRIAKPITSMVTQLKNSDPDKPIVLSELGIIEIDELRKSIEILSHDVAESASRISKIIALTNIPLGVFEIKKDSDKVFYSPNLAQIIDMRGIETDGEYISREDFNERMLAYNDYLYDKNQEIYSFPNGDSYRWVKLFYVTEKNSIFGAALDITKEMEEKRKIEYERDYDLLTGLYNRRAFERMCEDLIEKGTETLKISAMLMMDMDNLKYINDFYGHDCGDEYIRCFAEGIKSFENYNAIAARRSGDEFYVFLYSYNSKQEIRDIISSVWEDIASTSITLPGGDVFKIRASGGLTWYPDDSDNFNKLIYFADFAMYKVKHSVKGTFSEFDKELFKKDSILFDGHETLSKLLENELMDYAMQPIIRASDGSIYGYEMLMRSSVRELPTSEILRLAKSQSKLQQIEKLTWFKALETFNNFYEQAPEKLKDVKIFINTITSQPLEDIYCSKIITQYKHLMSQLVIELTENEQTNFNYTSKKINFVRENNGLVAIDDYGSGYNGEISLMTYHIDIIKVDISIIHNIDQDKDRLILFQHIVDFARNRDMSVLAEGVETLGELETVIKAGANLIQGFYVGHPEFKLAEVSDEVLSNIRRINKEMISEE